MPAPSWQSRAPGAGGLRGALAGHKKPPPGPTACLPAVGRAGSPVHALQGRVRGAFCVQIAPDPPTDLERAMGQARAIHRANVEGVRRAILTGEIQPAAAARWISADVEICITGMLEAVLDDLHRRHGRAHGGVAVLAMGKLGGRELCLGSDVDLIFVCEAGEGAGEDERRHADELLQKAAQMMSAALSWSQDAGRLYDLDMRLRPFGTDGALATPFSLFTHYYGRTRWTWELQALTRARVIGDDSAFGLRLTAAVNAALRTAPPASQLMAEVADMRRLMAREQPAKGPWDLKRTSGGLIDLEFIVQALQLAHANACPGVCRPCTEEAVTALAAAGVLPGEDARTLAEAWRLYSTVRQLQGAAGLAGRDLRSSPADRHEVMLASLGAHDWPAVRGRIDVARAEVRKLFRRVFGVASAERVNA